MIILAIDPSSTATGWAVLRPEKHEIIAYGVWRGSRKDDSYVRIEKMCRLMFVHIELFRPQHVVIEVTSGKLARRLAGTEAHIAMYGVAVGAFWAWLRLLQPGLNYEAHRVYENEWTDGVPKIKRHPLVLAEFPEHADDIGKRHDVTDAIGLGMWWWSHRKMLERTA